MIRVNTIDVARCSSIIQMESGEICLDLLLLYADENAGRISEIVKANTVLAFRSLMTRYDQRLIFARAFEQCAQEITAANDEISLLALYKKRGLPSLFCGLKADRTKTGDLIRADLVLNLDHTSQTIKEVTTRIDFIQRTHPEVWSCHLLRLYRIYVAAIYCCLLDCRIELHTLRELVGLFPHENLRKGIDKWGRHFRLSLVSNRDLSRFIGEEGEPTTSDLPYRDYLELRAYEKIVGSPRRSDSTPHSSERVEFEFLHPSRDLPETIKSKFDLPAVDILHRQDGMTTVSRAAKIPFRDLSIKDGEMETFARENIRRLKGVISANISEGKGYAAVIGNVPIFPRD